MTLTIGSVCAGIGGLDLGFERAGFRIDWQIEKDPYCLSILARHWPEVTRYDDLKTATNLPEVDVVVGGIPCQPWSVAGSRQGSDDDRDLWPDFWRLCCELRPRVVVVEEVPAFTLPRDGLLRTLADLADGGYGAAWGVVSALDIGAPHLRRRLFLVAWDERDALSRPLSHAVSDGGRCEERGIAEPGGIERERRGLADRRREVRELDDPSIMADAAGERRQVGEGIRPERAGAHAAASAHDGRDPEPGLGLGSDGVPAWLDEPRWPAPPNVDQHSWEPPRTCKPFKGRPARVRALGNAVMPHVAELLARRILEALT